MKLQSKDAHHFALRLGIIEDLVSAAHDKLGGRAVQVRAGVSDHSVAPALAWPGLMLADDAVKWHLDRQP